jgi:hypothetical protein
MVFDLQDLDSPELLTIFNAPVGSADHNLYVLGDRVYQANYASGLRILDISRIAEGELRQAAYFDIYPETDDAQFNGAWSVYPYFASGTIVVSGIEGGLFVVRPTATTSLNLTRFDVTVDEGAADVTWVVERNSGAPITLQRRHEGGPFVTVATLDPTAAPEYHVEGLSPGRHQFRLVQLGADGRIQVSDAAEATVTAPENFRVSRLFPGQRQGTTALALTVAEPQQVRLDVVDGSGRRVKTVFDGMVEGGMAEAFEVFGEGLPSDAYTLRITGESFEHELALSSFDTSANRPGP